MNDRILNMFEHLYGSDRTDLSQDPPVFRPEDAAQLADIIKKASESTIPVSVKGAGTYPVPGASREAIVISTLDMATEPVVDAGDFIAVTPAGVTVAKLSTALTEKGFTAPLDILYGAAATVGGAYMSGAFGLSGYMAGVLRDAVIGVRCVAADGSVVTGGGRTAKNVTGYEMARFFAGTMGLFGIAFELTIKLNPAPQAVRLVRADYNAQIHRNILDTIIRDIRSVTGIEAAITADGKYVISVTVEGLDTIVEQSVWRVEKMLSDAGNAEILTVDPGYAESSGITADISGVREGFHTVTVPPFSTMQFIERIHDTVPGVAVLAHPLAGKVHFVTGEPEAAKMITELSLALGGKPPVSRKSLVSDGISGLFSPQEYNVLTGIKRELDPDTILNPHILRPVQ